MKIKIKHHDREVKIKIPNDPTVDEIMNTMLELVYSIGYHPDLVKKWIRGHKEADS
jgi:hypothetical protein